MTSRRPVAAAAEVRRSRWQPACCRSPTAATSVDHCAIPASFCNVVGFRPSPGRVPVWPTPALSFRFLVEGPMARTVEDVALMLSTIAGPDPRSPIAIAEPGHLFARPLARDFTGLRVAWSENLGGLRWIGV